ncbi:MAG: 50S ribosomal protein L35 [candidate division WOR-3 bacterium]
MPKMKTKKSALKRFKITAKGKIKRYRAFHSHLAQSKNPKRKRRLRKHTYVSKEDEKKIKKILPYL